MNEAEKPPILDFITPPDLWQEVQIDLKGDMKVLGFDGSFIDAIVSLQMRGLPFAHLGYNPDATRLSRSKIEKVLGQPQGRGFFFKLPTDEIIYCKGGGSYTAAVLDTLNRRQQTGTDFIARGFGLYTDTIYPIGGDRIWGAMRLAEALDEYINGLVIAKIFYDDLLADIPEENLPAADYLISQGLVFPLGVVRQPELTELVMKTKFPGEVLNPGKELVTMFSLAPSERRVSDKVELGTQAEKLMQDCEFVERVASNVLRLLEYGILMDRSGMHPQNLYDNKNAAILLADAGDQDFLSDFWKPEMIVLRVAEVLGNIRFLPSALPLDGLPDSTGRFYGVLLGGRKLTGLEEEVLGMPAGERGLHPRYWEVMRGMAEELYNRCYDSDRWEGALAMRYKLADKYKQKFGI